MVESINEGTIVLALPDGFVKKYQKLMGDSAASFFVALGGKPLSGFRTNPLKDGLPEDSINAATGKVAYVPTGYYGHVSGQSLDHVTGWVYSQEPSAMYVGEVVDPQPGEKVLDLCAAPGGKSTHLIAKMNDSGLLVANEIFRKRAQVLASNLERWGVRHAVVTSERPDELSKHFPAFFDRILVDAPCSGEGMFRKDPSAMEYWNEDYPRECANRQRKILDSALKMLKPGGILVYSTCTFSPEEDEQNIAWLLKNYSLKLLPIKKWRGMDNGRSDWADGNDELAKCVRLFPHHFRGEGHFIAKMQLTSDLTQSVKSKNRRSKKKDRKRRSQLESSQRKEFKDFLDKVMPDFHPEKLVLFGDRLFDCPVLMPDITNLSVLRPGLQLGVFKKRRFEPALAWALATNPASCARVLELSEDQWRNYVHGDAIMLSEPPASGNGWYLLTCQKHSCGWGKLVGNQIKNFYPKGLRF